MAPSITPQVEVKISASTAVRLLVVSDEKKSGKLCGPWSPEWLLQVVWGGREG